MIPTRSPWGLIQEDLWSSRPESEWYILVACIMLNCTTRKQVERVLPTFLQRWPSPVMFMNASDDDVRELCKPLGFANKRTTTLKKMTEHYVSKSWKHASELPGIGAYASRAWEMFCCGIIGNTPPKDHSLTRYWLWHTKGYKQC